MQIGFTKLGGMYNGIFNQRLPSQSRRALRGSPVNLTPEMFALRSSSERSGRRSYGASPGVFV
jgi:hypothetical protein